MSIHEIIRSIRPPDPLTLAIMLTVDLTVALTVVAWLAGSFTDVAADPGDPQALEAPGDRPALEAPGARQAREASKVLRAPDVPEARAKGDAAFVDAGPASGQWRGMVAGESDSLLLIIDVGTLDGEEWIGEIDIPHYGVEGYPIEVEVDGDHLILRFWSTVLDGRISPDGKSYVSTGNGGEGEEDETVVLHRSGDPEFSALRIEMETAGSDPGAVHALAADGGELRERFNQEKDKVRLLLLLAPS